MGRHKSAVDDLNESLNLNPDFFPARLQRAISLFRQGSLDEARVDFEYVLHVDPHHEEANHYYSQIETNKILVWNAEQLIESHNWHEALDVLSKLIQDMYSSYHLKEMRAYVYEQLGDIVSAINDVRSLTRMRADNTEGFLKLSQLSYSLGEPEESLNAIRQCLKLDPDHKKCHDFYKHTKKLVNSLKVINEKIAQSDYGACVDKAKATLKLETQVTPIVFLVKSKLCQCLNKVSCRLVLFWF